MPRLGDTGVTGPSHPSGLARLLAGAAFIVVSLVLLRLALVRDEALYREGFFAGRASMICEWRFGRKWSRAGHRSDLETENEVWNCRSPLGWVPVTLEDGRRGCYIRNVFVGPGQPGRYPVAGDSSFDCEPFRYDSAR